VEAAPIYYLHRRIRHSTWEASDPWDALERLNAMGIADPYHVQVIFQPYPDPLNVSPYPSAFLNLMERIPIPANAPDPTSPVKPTINSDSMAVLGGLLNTFTPSLLTWLVRIIVREQIQKIYPVGDIENYPGNMFGPTHLAPGPGCSTEIFVDQTNVKRALETIRDELHDLASTNGYHLAGGIGVRIIKGTEALLGMNRWPLTACIELPSIRTSFVHDIYRHIYRALEMKNIEYVCHWGQQHQMTPGHIHSVYGAKATAWKNVRRHLLDATGQWVFGTDHLTTLGLD
jgi:hypothetical protein